jgi:DNA-binding PadR family transcriptional regulator
MVPDVTHLQYLILCELLDGEHAGRDLRALLEGHGVLKSAPAFYQLMARLEDSGLVRGRYEQKVIDGQRVKERRYKITAKGATSAHAVEQFYLERLGEKQECLLGGLAGA